MFCFVCLCVCLGFRNVLIHCCSLYQTLLHVVCGNLSGRKKMKLFHYATLTLYLHPIFNYVKHVEAK